MSEICLSPEYMLHTLKKKKDPFHYSEKDAIMYSLSLTFLSFIQRSMDGPYIIWELIVDGGKKEAMKNS